MQFPSANALKVEEFLRDIQFLNYANSPQYRFLELFDINDAVRFEDDFLFEEIDFYTEYIDAGGSATVIDFVNGVLALTCDGDDNDEAEYVQDFQTWRLVTGFPFYFETRLKVTDVVEADYYTGIVNAAGLWNGTATDGIYFRKDDDDASLIFCARHNSVDTDVDTGIDLVNLTWCRLGFHWDGNGTLRWFVYQDGVRPQILLATGLITAGFAQDEEMQYAFGVRAGEDAEKTIYTDLVKIAMSRITSL